MNIYRFTFTKPCPVNGKIIYYRAEIRSGSTIEVESIQEFAALAEVSFHEDIADAMFRNFGGEQRIHAEHHGVHIETVRP